MFGGQRQGAPRFGLRSELKREGGGGQQSQRKEGNSFDIARTSGPRFPLAKEDASRDPPYNLRSEGLNVPAGCTLSKALSKGDSQFLARYGLPGTQQ